MVALVCKDLYKDYCRKVSQFQVERQQYCQTRSVNILTRVCRELSWLSRSKHTLVNILTIDPSQYSDYTILVWFGFH